MISTAEMKSFLGIGFSAHPMLTNLFIMSDVNMGWRFFSKYGAAIITNSISEKMHELLLQHIRTMDGKLGIILDGSTDHNNNHLVTVLFQLLENNAETNKGICVIGHRHHPSSSSSS